MLENKYKFFRMKDDGYLEKVYFIFNKKGRWFLGGLSWFLFLYFFKYIWNINILYLILL